MTPLQRSVHALRADGWLVDVVEHYNSFSRVTNDLYGFIDLLALRGPDTLAVQVTSASNVSARIHKIADSPNLAAVRAAGWRLQVHGWSKKGTPARWANRIIDVS